MIEGMTKGFREVRMSTITAGQDRMRPVPDSIKSFQVDFPPRSSPDVYDLGSGIVEEVLACLDQGDMYTISNKPHQLRINGMPAVMFSGWDSAGFGTFFTGTVEIHPDSSIQLHLDFHDRDVWRVRQAEALVAYALSHIYDLLARFSCGQPGPHWRHLCGEWKHGALFTRAEKRF
jgi:hypothetical protein